MNWLNLPKEKQQELFKQLSVKTGIQPQAIEKDAWVMLVLKIIFISQYKKDYSEMLENMIYDNKISSDNLINKLLSIF